jgi:hypothetical protein
LVEPLVAEGEALMGLKKYQEARAALEHSWDVLQKTVPGNALLRGDVAFALAKDLTALHEPTTVVAPFVQEADTSFAKLPANYALRKTALARWKSTAGLH